MDLRYAIHLFVYAIIAVLIFALLWWLVDFAGLPSPFGHVLHVVLILLAVLVLIGFLLKLLNVSYTSGPPAPPVP